MVDTMCTILVGLLVYLVRERSRSPPISIKLDLPFVDDTIFAMITHNDLLKYVIMA